MNALEGPIPRPETLILGVPVRAIRRPDRLVFGVPLALSVVALFAGGAALFANRFDAYAVPAAGLLGLGLLGAVVYLQRRTGRWDRTGILLVGLCLGANVLLLLLPEYLYGWQVNGILHRSVFSAPLLLLLSVFAASYAIRSLLGSSPSAQDLALYPLLGLPVALALLAYGLLLWSIVSPGVAGLSLDLLTKEYRADPGFYQPGLRNNLLGTGLLVAMTSLLAFLPGVGAGVFMSEYPGRLASVVGFCTTMLRAVSLFIIGAAAFSLVGLVRGQPVGSPIADLIRGVWQDQNGYLHPGSGSFLTASFFLSLIVMPVIAKLTEEGLRSVPQELREGSVALGATEGYGLRRILLPWAGPNILTGLLLGMVEAIGGLAVIFFIAGAGAYGVSPAGEVTSLDWAVFATMYGPKQFQFAMAPYKFTAALLLLALALGLTLVAMLVRRRFAKRYRGSLTVT